MKPYENRSLLTGDLFPISQSEFLALQERARPTQRPRTKTRVCLLGDLTQLTLPITTGTKDVKILKPVLSGGLLPIESDEDETPDKIDMVGMPTLVQVFQEPDAITYKQLWEHPVEVHAALLEGSLASLKAVTSATEKMEVLSWIFEPDILGWIDDVGEIVWYEDVEPQDRASYAVSGWTPMWNVERALSFQRCCKLFGFRADLIQDEIERILFARGIKILIQ